MQGRHAVRLFEVLTMYVACCVAWHNTLVNSNCTRRNLDWHMNTFLFKEVQQDR